jgi:SulP family sulfate permease
VAIPIAPGKQTEPGSILCRFGADLFYADAARFIDDVRTFIDSAPTPVHWFVVGASAITDLDFSAARAIHDLLVDLTARKIAIAFARVAPYLRAYMDRHRITAAVRAPRIFATFHEAPLPPFAPPCPTVRDDDE